jgi:two-component system NtrC family response regulator
MVITVSEETIQRTQLPAEVRTDPRPATRLAGSLAEAVEECEKTTIQTVLQSCNFHREKTAKALGISVRTLHYKMSRYGLH